MVTIGKSKDEKERCLIYGGYELDNPYKNISWHPYILEDDYQSNDRTRTFWAESVFFQNINFTNTTSRVRFLISNSIEGMMLRTKDKTRAIDLKKLFKEITKLNVTAEIEGPMLKSFIFKNATCDKVKQLIGNKLTVPPKDENDVNNSPIKIDASPFF